MRRLGCSAGFMVVNRAGSLRLGLLAEDGGWGGATRRLSELAGVRVCDQGRRCCCSRAQLGR